MQLSTIQKPEKEQISKYISCKRQNLGIVNNCSLCQIDNVEIFNLCKIKFQGEYQ